MKKTMNKKGFTIVELVIVIAVIAILAAVLIPTFSGIIGKATVSSAVQQARSTLTNALAMSSTAQLPGTDAEGNYQTVFVLNSAKSATTAPDFAWGYNGNALEDLALEYDKTDGHTTEVKTAFGTGKFAKGFNSILTGANAVTSTTDAEGTVTYSLNTVTKALIENCVKDTVTISRVDGNYLLEWGTDNAAHLYTSVDIATNIVVFTSFAG